MKEFLIEHLSKLIVGGVFGFLGWIFGRKKQRIDEENAIIKQYKDALDDLDTRYKKKFDDLESEIEKVKQSVVVWKNKYQALKREFDNYKKKHERDNSKS